MNSEIRKKYLERKAEKAKKTSSYVDLSDNIALTILNALKEANLNKTEFARKLGKDTSVISRWLNGQHNFTIKTIVDIENALNKKIVLPMNKAEQATSFKSQTIIMSFGLNYNKDNFSKLIRNNSSSRNITLTDVYDKTLTFKNN
ncbi:MAG: helix-turn-helix domain-containing protein [Flavobacterium sp.]|jgi:ribosome-binding protein aMBF1 (putative translation factor)|uniref:helix-turn-helix domain-containing protein n=1 Tax=Flavobacterium sp. TaxID=239 RepID=UPI003BA7F692